MNSNCKKSYPKPIIKWVGGKTQIIDKLVTKFPCEMGNYHEIFLGGGSVLFALLSKNKDGSIKCNGHVFAYDLNEPLIFVYKNIQLFPLELFYAIEKIKNVYCRITGMTVNRKPISIEEAILSKESYYYWIRSEYNKLSVDDKKSIIGSSMLIFLNKTCFRGIFRVGPNGFNVPYGWNKNPDIVDREHLQEISMLIQNVTFESCNFQKSMNNITYGDFTYLDPPYAPETANSFVAYTVEGFSIDKHKELFTICKEIAEKKINMMMSNSNVSMVLQNFPAETFNVEEILCKRLINSKNPKATTQEVLIKNY